MDSIQINLTTPTKSRVELSIGDITYSDNSFVIEIPNKSYLTLHVGQTIYIERKLYKGNGEYEKIAHSSTILEITHNEDGSSGKIRINSIEKNILTIIDSAITHSTFVESAVTDDTITHVYNNNIILMFDNPHNVFQQDLSYFSGYTMHLFDEHYNYITSFSGTSISVPSLDTDEPISLLDCFNYLEERDCSDNYSAITKVYEYVFLPKNASRKNILISGVTSINGITNIDGARYATFKFNPYFFQDENGIRLYTDSWLEDALDCENIPEKQIIWSGVCDGGISEEIMVDNENIEILSSDSRTYLVVYDSFYNLNLGLSADINDLSLGAEDSFSESFTNSLVDDLIPDIIDMEKIKYSPGFLIGSVDSEGYYIWYSPEGSNRCNKEFIYTSGIGFTKGAVYDENSPEIQSFYEMNFNGDLSGLTLSEGDYFKFDYEYGPHFKNGSMPTLYRRGNGTQCTYYLSDERLNRSFKNATKISFYLHFIKRAEIPDNERATANTVYTSGNVYYDTWHIDAEEKEFIWWNGFDYSGDTFSAGTFVSFYETNRKKSDLMGYLNFTDNDIYYRKKKVSQSFLRLSFYTSKDPYTQKMLYYSTIFLDEGELYGKYIKQLQNEDFKKYKEKNSTKKMGKANENALVVLYSAGTRVDSKITVTNEYDRTKSSEGFNIYLFAEDKTFEAENGEKTIYMKVEFNHAGNGKTIPLIMWPKDANGEFCSLTTENFIDTLYIPVKLAYINGRYVYSIVGAENENDEIVLILFEPKLDMIQDIEIDGV